MSDASFGQLDALITAAIRGAASGQHTGSSTGPAPKPEDFTWRLNPERAARAVRDALLAEGHVCTDWGQYAHYWRRSGALVITLGRDAGETP